MISRSGCPAPCTTPSARNWTPGSASALLSWLAFTATFAGVRGITYSIRAGKGPFGNLSVGGEHLHHYMWGIGILDRRRRGRGPRRGKAPAAPGRGRSATAPGLALIVDEFALLLDLKDVYWAKQGRISVDVGVSGIALAGSYFAALPVLRAVRRDRRKNHRGHADPAPAAGSRAGRDGQRLGQLPVDRAGALLLEQAAGPAERPRAEEAPVGRVRARVGRLDDRAYRPAAARGCGRPGPTRSRPAGRRGRPAP